MHKKVREEILLLFLLLLPGCGRVMDWTKRDFSQGTVLADLIDIPQHYIQQIVVHDQLKTEAKFVALWASAAPVVQAYVQINTRKYGKSEQEARKLLEEKTKEYQNYVVLYVLSLYNVPLGVTDSDWGVFLKLSDKHIQPESIKQIELIPEYKAFFDTDLTLFKDAYEVKFKVGGKDGTNLLRRGIRTMELYFRSVVKEVVLCWNILGPPIIFENDIRRNRPWHICSGERV